MTDEAFLRPTGNNSSTRFAEVIGHIVEPQLPNGVHKSIVTAFLEVAEQ